MIGSHSMPLSISSYPWDRQRRPTVDGIRVIQSSPDSEMTFEMLASSFASKHPKMSSSADACGHAFEDGMTPGSKWLSVDNSINDRVYIRHKTFMVPFMLSDD